MMFNKTTINSLLTVCLFSLYTFKLSAQINLCEGLYITVQGDTIRGKIDYQSWVSNPEQISFTATGLEKDLKNLAL